MQYDSDPRAWAVEAGESEVPGNPQLRAKNEASLGYMKSSINKTITTKGLTLLCIQESLGELGM